MKVVLQRCEQASVTVNKKKISEIGNGLVVLVGFTKEEDREVLDYMVDKIINLRIFDDENGVMNKSLIDVEGSILSVSQFTLYADASSGRRPSYKKALNGKYSSILYDEFNKKLREKNINVETGIFGEDMKVSLTNDGPVTIIIEKEFS